MTARPRVQEREHKSATWIACQNDSCRRRATELAESLKKEGIETLHVGERGGMGAGILLFEEGGDALYRQLETVSRGGAGRVLAIGPPHFDEPWDLLDSGASDVLAWDAPPVLARRAALRLARWAEVDELVASPLVTRKLVGRSRSWLSAIRGFVEVAHFTNSSVLITGESGTGKELVARMIHALDPRANKGDLVILDCTTVVPSLSGSEFFGHERGAFTGAINARAGAFEKADGGTLFLDEVSELPLQLQAELLRVVQEGTYKRVGSDTWKKTSFRLVAATNKDLMEEQAAGRFRPDLYHRLAAWTGRLPSLRERGDDVMVLTDHFLRDAGDESLIVDRAVRQLLVARDYPGNVRELKQLVARMVARHVGPGPISVGDVPEEERRRGDRFHGAWCDESFESCVAKAIAAGVGLKEITKVTTDTAVRLAMADENGSLQRAARRLGITARALQMRRAGTRDDATRGGDAAVERLRCD